MAAITLDRLDDRVNLIELNQAALTRRMDIRDLVLLGLVVAIGVLSLATFVIAVVLLNRL